MTAYQIGRLMPKFQHEGVDLLRVGPVTHQTFGYTMQCRQRLLDFSFQHHETHRWATKLFLFLLTKGARIAKESACRLRCAQPATQRAPA